jgi:hypothetical protein
MEGRSKSAIVVGAILIALGIFLLVTRFAPGFFGAFSWPFIIIGIGIVFLVIALATWTPGLAVPACIIGGIGGLLYWQNQTGAWDTWSFAWALIPAFSGVGVFLNETMEGRPLKGIVDGGWPVLIGLLLFFLFGSFFGRIPWLGPWWAVVLIVIGVLVLLRPLVRKNRSQKQ